MCQNVLMVWHNSTELFEYLIRRNLKYPFRSWYRQVEKTADWFLPFTLPSSKYWAHIEMSEFKTAFYLLQRVVSLRWLVHSQLALSPDSCTCLPVFGSNSANWPRSELQFCENPVRLLNELCSFTFASPVSDCFFNVSLFSVWILAEVCSLSWALYQWTAPFAIMCVFRYSRTVVLRSEQGTGCCVADRQLVTGWYQPQLWWWRCQCVSSVQRCACRCCSLNLNVEMRRQSEGTELPLMVESYGLNDILPFLSILDSCNPVFNLHLANVLFDVILPSVLGSSLWSFD